jgi:fucose 4-O-acetylase-like acetyltransferase
MGVVSMNQSGYILLCFMRTYDMPFFMILSGYFLRKSQERGSTWKVVTNRISTLVVPIVIWTFARGSLNVFGGMYYFLWAVVCSCVVCATASGISSCAPDKLRMPLQLFVYVGAVVLMHLIKMPYNLFYLFPFFALGYLCSRLRFSLPEPIEMCLLLAWVLCMCFWHTNYTPWQINGVAWKGDSWVIVIYLYRFVLALLGVHFVWKICDGIRIWLKVDSWMGQVITNAGRESMAMYLLHMFPILAVKHIIYACPRVNVPECANIIGYVIAPLISFLISMILFQVVQFIKGSRLLKWTLGFKVV